MFRTGSIDFQDTKEKVFKYAKYFVVLLGLLPVFLILNHYIVTYKDIEDDLVDLARKYIYQKNLKITDETYIPLGALGELEGAELCSNASGVIVTLKGKKLKYQPYLKCTDYETEFVYTSDKYIYLSGDAVTLLNANEIYEEMGYYSEEDVEVEISGEVKSVPGIYTVEYKVYEKDKLKQTLERKVIVTNYEKTSTNSGVVDSVNPTLNLLGNTTMFLVKGEEFVEPGYRAVDYKDGKISRKVKVEADVNLRNISNDLGEHKIKYTITNSKGKTTSKVRTVKVVEQKSDIIIDHKIIKETSGYSIILNIIGMGYRETLLPNNEVTNDFNISYKVTKNQVYVFKIYDDYGNAIVREVDVNDYDITGPEGSCIANTSSTSTTVYVTANDKSGISGYNYVINGVATNFQKNSTYTKFVKATDVIVQVKDAIGNYSTLTCQLNKNGNAGQMINGVMQMQLLIQKNYTKKTPLRSGKTDTVKRSGCGPTSVSMVVRYLTGNYSQDPQSMFEYMLSLGACQGGTGCGKGALTKAAQKYGVTCEWKKLTADEIKQTLLSGNPIIAFMGPKTFTSTAHYIVLKGVTGNKIAVNDPNSESRSQKTYDVNVFMKESKSGTSFAVCHL